MKPFVTLMLVFAWLVAPVLAQEETTKRGKAEKDTGFRRITRQQADAERHKTQLDRIRKRLQLTEDQREEFDRIAAEFMEQRTSDSGRHQELVKEMRAARKANDQQRVKELQAELQDMRGGQSMAEFFDRIEPILNDEQLETLAELRARNTSRRGRAGRPLAQLASLRDKLELSDEQAEQYDALYAELKEEIRGGRGDSADVNELIRQMTEAAEAGDEERIAELKEQLPGGRDTSEQAIAEFFEEVESFLEPEQRATLRQFQRDMKSGRSRGDLRSYFAYASRLDLDRGQRDKLREIQRESRKAEREARRDPAAHNELLTQVEEQIRDILTDEQVAKFDRWIEDQKQRDQGRGRDRDRKKRGEHRGGRRSSQPDTP
jgi:hypothetical protein